MTLRNLRNNIPHNYGPRSSDFGCEFGSRRTERQILRAILKRITRREVEESE